MANRSTTMLLTAPCRSQPCPAMVQCVPAGHRWALRPVLKGVHPRHGSARSSTNWPRKTPRRNQFHGGHSRDDITHTQPRFRCFRFRDVGISLITYQAALFFGLGSGWHRRGRTRTPSRSSAARIPDLHGQAYFRLRLEEIRRPVTVSHLRFGPQTHSTRSYLIGEVDAGFIACHQFEFIYTRNTMCWTMQRRVPCCC